MRNYCTTVVLAIVLLFGRSTTAEVSNTAEAYFHQQIKPILVSHCLACHGDARKGQLDLRSKSTALAGGESGKVVEPGNADGSLLYEYVSSGQMPPDKPLDAEQILAIKKWIDQGAYLPKVPLDPFAMTTELRAGYDWWSLQPLNQVEAPEVTGIPASWQQHTIDRLIAARLVKNGLQPSPPADPRTLIRRATYDLIGLPPTPEEVEAFLSACQRETGTANQVGDQAYVELIDRLLQSPHYGEHWGRHWLDVVRFGESNGFERNVIHNSVWPFRDYVIRSLNDDKPFDRLVLEHLAGDVLGPNNPDVAVGTAFLVCGPYDNVGNQDPAAAAQIRANTIDEIIRASSEAFLGLTVGCSRCHDHKFDPISQRDYYGMYASFAGVQHGERTLQTKQHERQLLEIGELQKQIDDLEQQLWKFRPLAFMGSTIVMDDELPAHDLAGQPRVTHLRPPQGHQTNPPGTEQGYRDDPGDLLRTSNLSGQRFTWWDNSPEIAHFSWHPATAGRFRVWLSWGCGRATHTSDAKYVLDLDGDLTTDDDRQLLATVDQKHFAEGGPAPLPNKALWSGFLDAGVHDFRPTSQIVLLGGSQGEVLTADVVVLQEEIENSIDVQTHGQPRFRQAVYPKVNSERIAPIEAKYLRFTITATNSVEPCLDELEVFSVESNGLPARNVAAKTTGAKVTSSGDYVGNPKHQLSHINDGEYGNSRSWISNQNGGGWVQIEFAETHWIDRIVWGRDREEKYTDRLATSYKIEVAMSPENWKVVASSIDRLPLTSKPNASNSRTRYVLPAQRPERARLLIESQQKLIQERDRLKANSTPPKWWIGNFKQAKGPFHVFLGGDPQQRGSEVEPASMKAMNLVSAGFKLDSDSPESERRLKLAQWIVAKDNPLPPRVLANRLWHYHFGTGIVSTPSDLGFLGGRPSHPELLDWLATSLLDQGWRLKPMHKTIMLSQAYRQSSNFRVEAAHVDGDSRLLWRFPPRRLSGEEIRDSALAIADKLDTRMGGPGFRLFRYVEDNVATYYPLDRHGPETYRRAIYHHNARAMQIDLMTEFDKPDCAFPMPRRSSTITPLQALTLMNHNFTLDMAAALAQRIEQDVETVDTAGFVERAFQLAFARPPRDVESREAEELIQSHGPQAFCRALLNANEFIYLE